MTVKGDVLVVGGGISGLSAAIALGQAGYKVNVVERSTSIADGAAITITNRGNDALEELGALDACKAEGVVGMSGTMFNNMFTADGRPLNQPPSPERSQDGIPSYITIYRPTLARILGARAEQHGAIIRRGITLKDFTQDSKGVDVTLSDGAVERYDLVVGADGSFSEVRSKLFGKICEPVYSGLMSLRWVKPNPPSEVFDFYIDEHSNAVVAMKLYENLVYIAAGKTMENRRLSQPEAVAVFREVLSGFPARKVKELLDMVEDDDNVIARPYCYHVLPKPWHLGRVVVIGDAAHTMSAHLSSGGTLGIEDAVVLGAELARSADLESGLTSFEERRFPRVSSAIHACRDMLLMNVRGEPQEELHKVRTRALSDLLHSY